MTRPFCINVVPCQVCPCPGVLTLRRTIGIPVLKRFFRGNSVPPAKWQAQSTNSDYQPIWHSLPKSPCLACATPPSRKWRPLTLTGETIALLTYPLRQPLESLSLCVAYYYNIHDQSWFGKRSSLCSYMVSKEWEKGVEFNSNSKFKNILLKCVGNKQIVILNLTQYSFLCPMGLSHTTSYQHNN